MKNSTILAIKFYQSLLYLKYAVLISALGLRSECKHDPSCSQYTLQAIERDGTIRGLWLGVKRILSCW